QAPSNTSTTPTTTPSPAPAPSPTPVPPAPKPVETLPSGVAAAMEQAKKAMAENRLVDARTLLNNALANTDTREPDKEGLRNWIAEINQTLVFSPTIAP